MLGPEGTALSEAEKKYAQWLFGTEKHLWALTPICLGAEVEKPWVKLQTETGADYFWNEEMDEATYDHPHDANFQQLVSQYKNGKLSVSELERELKLVATVKPGNIAVRPAKSPVSPEKVRRLDISDSARSPGKLFDERSTSSSASLDLDMLGDHSDQKPETGGSAGAEANRDRWMAAMAEMDTSRQLRQEKEELEAVLAEKAAALEHALARTAAAEGEAASLRKQADEADVQRKALVEKVAAARTETAQKANQILELREKLSRTEEDWEDTKGSLATVTKGLAKETELTAQQKAVIASSKAVQAETLGALQSTSRQLVDVVEFKDALLEIVRYYEEQRTRKEQTLAYRVVSGIKCVSVGLPTPPPLLHTGSPVTDPALREIAERDVTAQDAQKSMDWRPKTVLQEVRPAMPEARAPPTAAPQAQMLSLVEAAAAASKGPAAAKEEIALEIDDSPSPPPKKAAGGWDFAVEENAKPSPTHSSPSKSKPIRETEVEAFCLDDSDED